MLHDLLEDNFHSNKYHHERKSKRALKVVERFIILCYTYVSSHMHLKKERERNLQLHFSLEGGLLHGDSSDDATSLPEQMGENEDDAVVFTMDQLARATRGFSSSLVLGQGSFGIVYKGKLRDGTFVAVKRAKKDTFEMVMSEEFRTEINMLASVDHLNLVKLIGYVDEGNERILVEEFVPNGNLRQHLDCEMGKVLDLSTRLDIAIDIAHALTYLHCYADRPIIHRDVKSTNILLTNKFRAKVADFGFSRAGSMESGVTHVVTQVKGTAGYLDPEYLNTNQLTPKSDVYSFGILLLELITGRWPIEPKKTIEERITVRWAFRQYSDGKIMNILDSNIPPRPIYHTFMVNFLALAFQCAAPTRQDRPNMREVAEQLWGIRKGHMSLLQKNEIDE